MKFLFTTILLLLAATTYLQAQKAGTPDQAFGKEGKILDTSIWAQCRAMAIQNDGKILTGGYTDDYDNTTIGGLYVARYNKDGSTDESFGEKGKFIIRTIPGANPITTQALAIQKYGKIIACGRFLTRLPYGNVGIVRLYPNGTIDSSFGINGFVVTKLGNYNDLVGGMVLQSDGRIVVAGNSESDFFTPGPDFVLRYLPDGTPDESFGNKGVVLTEYTTNVYLGAVALQPDGKIVTGGTYSTSIERFHVVRYNTDGSLDKHFGEGGFARLTPEEQDQDYTIANAITVQSDGKIILGGSAGTDYRIALARFNVDGSVDEGFGDKKGYTILPMDIGGGFARSVFYNTDDKKIMVTGRYYYDAAHQVAAVRYYDNGMVDSSFGENGIATGGFSESTHGGSDFSSGVGALQADGKIIVSGSFVEDNSVYNVALFRFNGDDGSKQPLAIRIKRWLQHYGISWQYNANVRYYNVQRSTDGGITYKEVASVSSKTNSYEDAALPATTTTALYRLAAIAKDGSRVYSNTVVIDDAQSARIFPNPVKDNLQLQGLPPSGKTNLSVMDLNGNVRSSATATGTSYSVNTANLSSGSYLLKIQHNGTTTTQPFVKE